MSAKQGTERGANPGASQNAQNDAGENKLIAERRRKLAALRERGQAFPNTFRPADSAGGINRDCAALDADALKALARRVGLAGRVIRMRGPFLVIDDGGDTIQLYLNHKQLPAHLAELLKLLDLGDIIGVEGEMFRTGKGELTVRVADFALLSKSLRPPPDKHKGLTDTELRQRRRYVDLIANPETRERFALRSRIVRSVREYFERAGFMEVETPMLQLIPGGAAARPFITHHNALDLPMYLRVAPELYLKRLLVGGCGKVFELNRNFRNEGLSTRHNPEFTMLEFYQAYAGYADFMDLTEDLLRKVSTETIGAARFTWQGKKIDLGKPFRRLALAEAVVEYCGLQDAERLKGLDSLQALARELEVSFDPAWGEGKLLLEVFERKVEHRLIEPVFITAYPTEVSPLSRRNDANPAIVDRFELFIAGQELANGFSELNDPEDQAERFRAQAEQRESGDSEAMHYDEDYIAALEYGMPPAAGEGLGIDRLVMLLTDSASIREVLLFPHMRPGHAD